MAAAGAVIDMTGGATARWFGTLTGSGAGRVEFRSGTFSTHTGIPTLNFPVGLLHWTSATANGSWTNLGTLQVSGDTDRAVAATITNEGTVIHSGAGDIIDVANGGGSVWVNSAGSLYEFTGSDGRNTISTFTNRGTVRTTQGAGDSQFTRVFHNEAGVIESRSGRLAFLGGGTWRAAEILADAPGVVAIHSDISVTGPFTGGGTGRFELADGGGLSSFDDGPASPRGVVDFPDDFFHWTGGRIFGNGLQNDGVMTISPLVAGPHLAGGLTNAGLIRHVGPGPLNLNGQTLDNRSGAAIELVGNVTILGRNQFNGQGTLKNDGLLRRVSGEGTATIDAVLGGTTGIVEVSTGRLEFSDGANQSVPIFEAAAGTSIEFTGNDRVNWSGLVTGSGPGFVVLNAPLGNANTGPTQLNFAPGLFQIVGGGLFDTLVNLGTIEFKPSSGVFVRAGITNQGTWIHSGTGDLVLNANTYFGNYGLYELQTDADLVVPTDGSGGPMRFVNTGTFRKTGGSGTSQMRNSGGPNSFQLSNTGTIDVASGTLSIENSPLQVSGTTLTAGTWIVRTQSTLAFPANGNFTTNRANVVLDGTGSTLANINALSNNSGRFELQGGRDFTTTGHLTNSGRVVAGPGSVLTVNGNLTQSTAAASLAGWWKGNGNTLDSSGLGHHGTISGTVPFVSGRYGEGFQFNGPVNVVPVGNPAARRVQDLTISAWIRREQLTAGGPIFGYGQSGYAFGILATGAMYLTHTGFSYVDSGPLRVTDDQFHHVAVTRSSNTITFYIDGQSQVVGDYNPSFSFFTNAGVGGIPGDLASTSYFNGRIDDVAIYNRALTAAEIQRVANGVNLASIGSSPPAIEVGIAGRPTTGLAGKVQVTGQATLTGQLTIQRDPGFGPTAGDQYEVMTCASRTGDFTSLTGHSPYFNSATTATNVLVGTILSAGDLAIDAVASNTAGVLPTGGHLDVQYTVRNAGSEPVSGGWTDSVFLSSDNRFSPDDVLLTRHLHTTGLSAGDSRIVNVTGRIPGVLDDDYFVIVVTNADKAVAEAWRANNTLVSTTQVRIAVPELVFGATQPGMLSPDAPVWFRLVVPAGTHGGELALTSAAGPGSSIELYVGRESLPDAGQFEFASGQNTVANPTLPMAGIDPGTYFVTVLPRRLSGPVAFSLQARTPALSLSSVSPTRAGAGVVTLQVRGSNLRDDDLVELVSTDGIRFAATDRMVSAAGDLFATFDLTGAVAGRFSLEVSGPGESASLPDAVTVEAVRLSDIATRLELPPRFRTGLVFNGTLVYSNNGNVDIPAPILVLTADDQTRLRLWRTDEFERSKLVLIGASQMGPAGILRPGEEWRIPFQPLTATSGFMDLALDYQTADATDPIDWDAVEATVRPPGMSDADWDRFWLPFTAEAGTTVGGYVRLMARYATEVQARGGDFVDAADVIPVAMRDLYERANSSIRGQLTVTGQPGGEAGAQILAQAESGSTAVAVTTSSDGSFHLPDLAPGFYNITVPGFLLSAPVRIEVTAGAGVPFVPLQVERGGVIRGVVRQSASEIRLDGISVELTGPGGFLLTTTDRPGTFEFTGLPAGLDSVRAGSGPWAVQELAAVGIDTTQRVRTVIAELTSASVVSGRVLSGGTPLSGVRTVVIDDDGNLVSLPDLTDSTGSYTVSGLQAGNYRLRASLAGFASVEQPFTITAGSDLLLSDLNLNAAASLSLLLQNEGTSPVRNALVRLMQGTTFVTLQTTGVNGLATFTDIAAGTYDLLINAPNLLSQQVSVTIAAGANDHTVTLSPAGAVEGIVRDGANQPIAGITVNVSGITSAGDDFGVDTTTKADGSYRVPDLPHGTYGITVGNGPGILRQDTTINAGSLLQTISFTIAGSGITGVVRKSDGVTPASDATVLLVQSGETLATATTDANGHYVFRALTAGTFSLQAAGRDGLTSAVSVVVPVNSTTTAPALTTGDNVLSGVVTSNGLPVADADIVLIPIASARLSQWLVTRTAADGSCMFDGLVSQSYQLQVERTGLVTQRVPLSLTGSATQNLALVPGVTQTGIITHAGLPLEGATVLFIDPATGRVLGADDSDATGRYEIEDVPAGTWSVLVHQTGLQSLHLTGVSVLDPPVAMDFALLAATTDVSGEVRETSGAAIASATVEIVNAGGQVIYELQSAFDGTWSTTALPAGTYTVRASLTNYYSGSTGGVVVVDGSPVTADLILTTAGTDDVLVPISTDSGQLAKAVADYLIENNPKPKRDPLDAFPRLTPPGRDACAEKEAAYVQAIFAGDQKDAAYESWVARHENYNTTIATSAGIFSLQLLNTLGSIVAVLKSHAIAHAVSAASGGAQAAVMASQSGVLVTQLGKVCKDARSLLKDGVKGKTVLNFAKNMFKLLDEGGEITHLIDVIGKAKHGLHLPFGIPFGTVVAIVNVIDLIKETAASAQALDNLSNSVPDARDFHLDRLDHYIARREHYSRITCSPDDPPEPDPKRPGPRARLGTQQSGDPNEKHAGGLNGTQFVRAGSPIDYTIHFENMPTATAAAQEIIITDVLDAGLDLSTLELTSVSFNGTTVFIPAGRREFESLAAVDSDSNPVRIRIRLNEATRTLTWTLTSIDPETRELTEDPDAGFLPPNDAENRGQGSVTFRVKTMSTLPSGAVIPNQARIVFDLNAPIDTPHIPSVIDAGPPASEVSDLPAEHFGSAIPLTWSGSDSGGSGIATFDVYVSENGGPYLPLLRNTTSTSTSFTGVVGRTDRFYSVATDAAGFTESPPATADATTIVRNPAVPTLLTPPATTTSLTPLVSWAVAPGAVEYDVWVSDMTRRIFPAVRTTTTQTSLSVQGLSGIGSYRVWVRSIDGNGNASAWSFPRDFRVAAAVTQLPVDRLQSTARPQFNWQTLPGAARYEVWISSVSTGQSPYLRVDNVTTSPFTPTTDLPLGRYRIWVRGFDVSGTAANWSTAQEFVVLRPPTATSPAGGTFDRTPEFSWTALPGAATYRLVVVNGNTGTTVLEQSGLLATSFSPATPLPDGPYRWWAYGVDAQGLHSHPSVTRSIYVGGRSDVLTPSGDITDTTPTFLWSAVSGAAKYSLWVNRVDAPGIVLQVNDLTAPTFTPVSALASGTYRVWVRAVSSSGELSPWSTPRDFRIVALGESVLPEHNDRPRLHETPGHSVLNVLYGLDVNELLASGSPEHCDAEIVAARRPVTASEPDDRGVLTTDADSIPDSTAELFAQADLHFLDRFRRLTVESPQSA
jgi:uncharacterized repeat protein (TIGR01451 family)